MKVALLGAEVEENLRLRYLASSLESCGHEAAIIASSSEEPVRADSEVLAREPQIVGLPMVFAGRAREFWRLAESLREAGHGGHITAQEEGIENVENLASADVVALAVRTHYNLRTLVDWIDKAILLDDWERKHAPRRRKGL